MLFLKETATGVDIPIQQLQQRLHSKLLKQWSIDDSKYKAYGRVYRNQKDDGFVPEAYIGRNEYTDSLFDDRVSVVSFFDVEDRRSYEAAEVTVNVDLTFCLRITDLKKGIAHRADEEVINDAALLCRNLPFGFTLTEIITGIDSVFKGYDIDPIRFRNMQPLLCFKLRFELLYNVEQC
jgi:hypothetical protein